MFLKFYELKDDSLVVLLGLCASESRFTQPPKPPNCRPAPAPVLTLLNFKALLSPARTPTFISTVIIYPYKIAHLILDITDPTEYHGLDPKIL